MTYLLTFVLLCAISALLLARRRSSTPHNTRRHARTYYCETTLLLGRERHVCECGDGCGGAPLTALGKYLAWERFNASLICDATAR